MESTISSDKKLEELKNYICNNSNQSNLRQIITQFLIRNTGLVNQDFINNIVDFFKDRNELLSLINGIYDYNQDYLTLKIKNKIVNNVYFPSYDNYDKTALKIVIKKYYLKDIFNNMNRDLERTKYLRLNIEKFDCKKELYLYVFDKLFKYTNEKKEIIFLNKYKTLYEIISKVIRFSYNSITFNYIINNISNEIYEKYLFNFKNLKINDLFDHSYSDFNFFSNIPSLLDSLTKNNFINYILFFDQYIKYNKNKEKLVGFLNSHIKKFIEKYNDHNDNVWIIKQNICINDVNLNLLLKNIKLNPFLIKCLFENYSNLHMDILFIHKIIPNTEMLDSIILDKTIINMFENYDIFLNSKEMKEYYSNRILNSDDSKYNIFDGILKQKYNAIDHTTKNYIIDLLPEKFVDLIDNRIVILPYHFYYYGYKLSDRLIKLFFKNNLEYFLYNLYMMGDKYEYLKEHFTIDNILLIENVNHRIFFKNMFVDGINESYEFYDDCDEIIPIDNILNDYENMNNKLIISKNSGDYDIKQYNIKHKKYQEFRKKLICNCS
jgi:hypothetical protein